MKEDNMTRVIVNGAAGTMGKAVITAVENDSDFELAAKVDRSGGDGIFENLNEFDGTADVIIDFSHHSAAKKLLDYAVEKNIPVLIATTGHTDEEISYINESAKKIPIFHSANMSIGVATLISLAKKAVQAMPNADIEIVETHHNRKLDAPSGTALMIAKALSTVRSATNFVMGRSGQSKRNPEDISISAVRRGNIVGIHEVLISTNNETLTLTHEAHSRSLFADGSLPAAKFLVGKPAGLYEMASMIEL